MEHGADVALTFFDLRKAFNSMSYLPLLQKTKDIGLEQHDLQWLTSYLSDVVVDGATSNASPVLSGVPCIKIGFRPVFISCVHQLCVLGATI